MITPETAAPSPLVDPALVAPSLPPAAAPAPRRLLSLGLLLGLLLWALGTALLVMFNLAMRLAA
ncbi:hypothetical protein [Achromobacter insuavis]|uniref:hypothetical protein n=1 Tax=Achromobacter insuavis TaxID=1287735 RepID=UPI001F12EC24|nr:hypothetical protein [Achromobacter insuavis]